MCIIYVYIHVYVCNVAHVYIINACDVYILLYNTYIVMYYILWNTYIIMYYMYIHTCVYMYDMCNIYKNSLSEGIQTCNMKNRDFY